MARWLRRTVLMLAVLLLTAIGVTPAQAGGTSTVLLSAPGIPKVVAVGYYEQTYKDLTQLMDPAQSRNLVPEEDRASGSFIRAVWMINDEAPWRLDMIYPDAPGGPWIATQTGTGNGNLASKPVWHRATNDVALIKLLVTRGLLGHQRGDQGPGGPTSLPITGSADSADSAAAWAVGSGQPPAEVIKADQGALTGWRWTIPGFLLGAVIAVLVNRLVLRRRPRQLTETE